MTGVILAAGKGTRMNSPDKHKVCYETNGIPVIGRTLQTFKECGIHRTILVVGELAGQVMETASRFDSHVAFCYQAEQKGTGNATRQAAKILEKFQLKGPVLVTAGDKVINPRFLRHFIHSYLANPCDLLFATGNAKDFPASGRIVYGHDHSPVGIVEVTEIIRAELLSAIQTELSKNSIRSEQIINMVHSKMSPKKASKVLGAFWELVTKKEQITREEFSRYFSREALSVRLMSEHLPVDALDRSAKANLSLYLFNTDSLIREIKALAANNAQKEEYLTDMVEILAKKRASIRTIEVERPTDIMAFNDPKELEFIRRTIQQQSFQA